MKLHKLKILFLFFCVSRGILHAATTHPENCFLILKNSNTIWKGRVSSDDAARASSNQDFNLASTARVDPSSSHGFSLKRLLEEVSSGTRHEIPQVVNRRLTVEERALADKVIQLQDATLAIGPAYIEFQKSHLGISRENEIKEWIDSRMENVLRELSHTRQSFDRLATLSEKLVDVLSDIESVQKKSNFPLLIAKMEGRAGNVARNTPYRVVEPELELPPPDSVPLGPHERSPALLMLNDSPFSLLSTTTSPFSIATTYPSPFSIAVTGTPEISNFTLNFAPTPNLFSQDPGPFLIGDPDRFESPSPGLDIFSQPPF